MLVIADKSAILRILGLVDAWVAEAAEACDDPACVTAGAFEAGVAFAFVLVHPAMSIPAMSRNPSKHTVSVLVFMIITTILFQIGPEFGL
jgi:hypothetical protein